MGLNTTLGPIMVESTFSNLAGSLNLGFALYSGKFAIWKNSRISFTFQPQAVKEIRRLMNEPGFDKSKFLRIGVKGGGCSGLSYILGFDKRQETDQLFESIRFLL